MTSEEGNRKKESLYKFKVNLPYIPAFAGFLLLTFSIAFDIYYSLVFHGQINVIPKVSATESFLIAYFPKISFFIVAAVSLLLLSCILLALLSRSGSENRRNISLFGLVLLGLFAIFPILPDIIFFIYPASNIVASYYHAMTIAEYYPGILAIYFLITAFAGTVLILRSTRMKARMIISYVGMVLMIIIAIYVWVFRQTTYIPGPYVPILNSNFTLNASYNFLYVIEAIEHFIPFHTVSFGMSGIFLIAFLLLSIVYFPVVRKLKESE